MQLACAARPREMELRGGSDVSVNFITVSNIIENTLHVHTAYQAEP